MFLRVFPLPVMNHSRAMRTVKKKKTISDCLDDLTGQRRTDSDEPRLAQKLEESESDGMRVEEGDGEDGVEYGTLSGSAHAGVYVGVSCAV
jgi:hypothetical protein